MRLKARVSKSGPYWHGSIPFVTVHWGIGYKVALFPTWEGAISWVLGFRR